MTEVCANTVADAPLRRGRRGRLITADGCVRAGASRRTSIACAASTNIVRVRRANCSKVRACGCACARDKRMRRPYNNNNNIIGAITVRRRDDGGGGGGVGGATGWRAAESLVQERLLRPHEGGTRCVSASDYVCACMCARAYRVYANSVYARILLIRRPSEHILFFFSAYFVLLRAV